MAGLITFPMVILTIAALLIVGILAPQHRLLAQVFVPMTTYVMPSANSAVDLYAGPGSDFSVVGKAFSGQTIPIVQISLSIAMTERGFFWTRDIVVENIPTELALSLNVEQPVLFDGTIVRVDYPLEVMCNPLVIDKLVLR